MPVPVHLTFGNSAMFPTRRRGVRHYAGTARCYDRSYVYERLDADDREDRRTAGADDRGRYGSSARLSRRVPFVTATEPSRAGWRRALPANYRYYRSVAHHVTD